MRIAASAAIVALAVLLAGCGGGPGQTTPTGSTTTGPAAGFDGEAALAFVKAFALRDDGSPRYRIPGTIGQQEGADYLWGATDLPGWQRSWHNLTGADYERLDRSLVAAYTQPGDHDNPSPSTPPGYNRGCTHEEHAAVPSLPFWNLLAIRPASSTPSSAPLLLGAHWDSQMHSDFDPDPAKRDLPDPGANDGASGVGVLLQLMRELDERLPALPFSVGVLFLDGEDGFYDCYPLAGSLHFAQNPPVDVAAFILLDMVGDPGAKFPREGYSRQSAPGLQNLLWRHGQARDGGQHFTDDVRSIIDDHLSFIQQGIPSVDVIDAGRPGTFPPQWNTAGDTVDKLDAGMLALVGDVLLAALDDPAMVDLLATG